MQYTNGNPAKIERNLNIAEERIAGASLTEIANRHNLSVAHVSNILSDSDIQKIITNSTKRMVQLVPKAVDNYTMLVNNPFHNDFYKANKDILQATGILASHAPATVINNIMYQDNRTLLSPEIAGLLRHQTDQQDVEEGEFEVVD